MDDGENTERKAEDVSEPAEPAPQAAAAPPEQAEAKPEESHAPEHKAVEAAAQRKEEEKQPAVGNVLLFGKWDVSSVALRDAGMARYIDVSAVVVPHSGGKHASKPFAKVKMSIVERLINGMMRTEDFTGKKLKAYRAVAHKGRRYNLQAFKR